MDTKISRVMLIDDHHPTNVLHSLVIENTNQVEETIIFENGSDALTYLKKPFDFRQPQPNIIFLDINMPVMNGWEFLNHFKNLPYNKRSEISLFMLSTSSHPDDIARAEKEDLIIDYLYKPLSEEILQDVIKQYFEMTEVAMPIKKLAFNSRK